MKKAIFFFSFLFAVGMATANAQSCQKSTAATKSCCANKAAKAAAADATIEKRQAEDGTVSYVRKETDAQGNVKFVSVQYDEGASTFVNMAPKSTTVSADDKATMTKKSASCSMSEKKACAGSAGSGKACCASKGTGSAAATPQNQ